MERRRTTELQRVAVFTLTRTPGTQYANYSVPPSISLWADSQALALLYSLVLPSSAPPHCGPQRSASRDLETFQTPCTAHRHPFHVNGRGAPPSPGSHRLGWDRLEYGKRSREGRRWAAGQRGAPEADQG
eukprot:COSAG03_NODE_2615_length_2592_cov_1.509828_1_plen_129_part_10